MCKNSLSVLPSLFLLCLPSVCVAESLPTTVESPGKTLSLTVGPSSDGGLAFSVAYRGREVTSASQMGITLASGANLTGNGVEEAKAETHSGTMITSLGEWAEHPDNYRILTVRLKQGSNTLLVDFRAYDEGFAYRYRCSLTAADRLAADMANLKLPSGLTCHTESGAESGYTEKSSTSTFSSLCPLLATSSSLSLCVAEAGNEAIANQAKLSCKGGSLTFLQSTSFSSKSIITPWRLMMMGRSPLELLDAKYIMRSLCPETANDTDWIKPGKVFRSLEAGTNDFHTDSVMAAIDFARKTGFSYVLLDAGWYGLGYSEERNPGSVPTQPRPTLDIEEVMGHAKDNGIGVLLYVNRVGWVNYDIENTLDTYASWGASGVKMGFVDGLSQSGMSVVYRVISEAAKRRMVVNVHDNYRPTGTERTLPNLLTVEGIRGDEHNPTADHAMRLPFSRFMCGPADFTFVFNRPGTETNRKRTRGQQLGLMVVFFSPLQHVLWYGKHWQYEGRESQLEFISKVPTVWDETRPLAGEVGEYVAMARRKGDTWYVGAATNAARSLRLRLDFLESGKKYDVTTYEDDRQEGICRTVRTCAGQRAELELDLLASGGAAAIITPTSGDTALPELTARDHIDMKRDGGRVIISSSTSALIRARAFTLGGIVAAEAEALGGTVTLNVGSHRGLLIVEVERTDGRKSRLSLGN